MTGEEDKRCGTKHRLEKGCKRMGQKRLGRLGKAGKLEKKLKLRLKKKRWWRQIVTIIESPNAAHSSVQINFSLLLLSLQLQTVPFQWARWWRQRKKSAKRNVVWKAKRKGKLQIFGVCVSLQATVCHKKQQQHIQIRQSKVETTDLPLLAVSACFNRRSSLNYFYYLLRHKHSLSLPVRCAGDHWWLLSSECVPIINWNSQAGYCIGWLAGRQAKLTQDSYCHFPLNSFYSYSVYRWLGCTFQNTKNANHINNSSHRCKKGATPRKAHTHSTLVSSDCLSRFGCVCVC